MSPRAVGRAVGAVDAYLGLGSNQGDSEALLAAGIEALCDVVAVSSIYRTAPVGGPSQPPFLNLVAHVRTRFDPHALLAVCQQAERAAGRVRTVRWGPRTLDVDVLLYGCQSVSSPTLTVPHPSMYERRFVLEPLAEIAPHLVTAAQLAAVSEQRCERLDVMLWSPARGAQR